VHTSYFLCFLLPWPMLYFFCSLTVHSISLIPPCLLLGLFNNYIEILCASHYTYSLAVLFQVFFLLKFQRQKNRWTKNVLILISSINLIAGYRAQCKHYKSQNLNSVVQLCPEVQSSTSSCQKASGQVLFWPRCITYF
jgi:hypothetical protein